MSNRLSARFRSTGLILATLLVAATFIATSPLTPSAAHASTTASGGLFVPLQQRIYDSRTTTYAGNTGNQLSVGKWYPVSVAGVGGAPTTGISAVQVTLTEVNGDPNGTLKADATGVASPNTSVPSLLWNSGKESNAATIPVGADGRFQIYVTATTDIVIDLQGYYTAGATAAGGYVPGTNQKILGSSSTSYTKGQSLTLQVAGTDQVPSNASAVMLSILVIPTDTTAGNLQVYPAGTPPSTPWLLNWSSSENSVFTSAVGLNASGKVTIAIQNGSTALQVAVQGYFMPTSPNSTAGAFTPIRSRAFDTRATVSLAPNETRTFPVAGVNGIPAMKAGIAAVAADLVIYPGSDSTTGKGSVLASADDVTENFWSQFFYPSEKVSAFSVLTLGDDGGLDVHNSSDGTIDVLLDVEGWYSSRTTPRVSCPSPYAEGSWTASTTAPISCSVDVPAATETGAAISTTVDGQPTVATSALSTTTPQSFAAPVGNADGLHEIVSTVSFSDGTTTTDTYDFGLGTPTGSWTSMSDSSATPVPEMSTGYDDPDSYDPAWDEPAAKTTAQQEGPCPKGTTSYNKKYAAYDCEEVIFDYTHHQVGIRQGRSGSEKSAFGYLHALLDHNVDVDELEAVIPHSTGLSRKNHKYLYGAEFRYKKNVIERIEIIESRTPSKSAPDNYDLGLVTAYCKAGAAGGPKSRCPDWVDDSL